MILLPEHYDQTPAVELLRQAEQGRIGFDQRLLRSLLKRPEETLDALEKIAPEPGPDAVVDLTEQIFDLYRALRSPRAIPFYLELLKHSREGVPDELVEAFAELGEAAVEPLLAAWEQASEDDRPDVLFVLASAGVPHPRLRELVEQAIENDPYEGALCASLCRDKELLPALRAALDALPPGESHRHERKALEEAIEALESAGEREEPEPFDILGQYPEEALPLFDYVPPATALEFLDHPDAVYRKKAAESFEGEDIPDHVRDRLLRAAKEDPDPEVRGAALRGLESRNAEPEVRELLERVLRDSSRPAAERAGALVSLAAPDPGEELHRAIQAAYEQPEMRAAAVQAMWRTASRRYWKQISESLKSDDMEVALAAVQAVGALAAPDLAMELEPLFEHEELREAALFSYALAVRHETTPKSVRRLLEKIADRAGGLSPDEEDTVAKALDVRLEREGYRPVFFPEEEDEPGEEDLRPAPVRSEKTGRNDPCPCGSGKKYKKCCGSPDSSNKIG
ncbi:MAG: HEAT repeat domain-containing protein [Bryobacteraceae bacterium]|jgi:HEAT repeat protein